MQKNQIKQKLAAGKAVYGAMVQFPDADLVELLGHAGFDWILIDAEHGTINENDCQHMVRACELANTTAIVRPPSNHAEIIMRYLDSGAQRVQVPRVNTPQGAQAAVDAVKYFPMGKRGVTSSSRCVRCGFGTTIPEAIEFSNAETLVCVTPYRHDAADEIRRAALLESGGRRARVMG
jgi:4-hydroxy-2-oxoheptanedioate aldolase